MTAGQLALTRRDGTRPRASRAGTQWPRLQEGQLGVRGGEFGGLQGERMRDPRAAVSGLPQWRRQSPG